MSNLLKKVVAGFSTAALVASSLLIPATSVAAATAGGVYKTTDGTVWFVTSDMHKRPFTSAGAFLSYGFLSFSQVMDADASVTALPTGSFIAPQDGRIFCATETKGSDVAGECSLVTAGQKAAFTSAAVFGGQGFSFSRAYYGDSSFLTKTSNIDNSSAQHRPGVLVNNNGTVQLVVNGGLWGVPSLDVFNSWGWSFADVVPANSADKLLSQIGIIPGRVAGQLVPTGTTGVNPTPTSGGPLSGGAGDLTLTATSSGVESSVKEGEEENILGVKAEADGSDVEITSVKVSFANCDAGCTTASTTSSENLLNYVDEVSVFLGDEMVGSVDADEFTKDTDSPDEFSKTISLDGAVVRDGDTENLYVAVSAVNTIDSDDLTNATWGVQLETMRFNDATGAILSADVTDFDTYAENDQFTFDDSSTDDSIELKSSTENPDNTNVEVDEDSNSDEALALAFKLDVDEDSQDVDVTSMTFTLTFVDLDSDDDGDITAENTATDVDGIIDSVILEIGGETYDADFDTGSVTLDADGDGTATFTADTDGLTISSGDVEEGMVSIVFNDADDFNEDQATVVASLTTANISAETADDELTVTGSTQTGAVLTPTLSGATVEVTDTSHSQNEAGTMGTFTFEVTITADGSDVDVDATSIVETVLGTDTSYTSITILNLDGDAVENTPGADYTVSDGESNTFSITYTHDPDNAGSYYIRLDSIDGVIVDELNGPETLAAA